MVKVILPAGFLRERVYALHILLHEFLGLRFTIEVDPGVSEYKLVCRNGELRIEDHFFGKYVPDGTYLRGDAIPDIVSVTTHEELDSILCLFGQDDIREHDSVISCGVDIVAGTFFMLTRWEEYVIKTRDRHGRFPATSSLAARSGFLHRPVVNEYSDLLKQWLLRFGVPQSAFRQRVAQVALQCDVDSALCYTWHFSVVRKFFFQLVKQRSLGKAIDEIAQYRDYLKTRRDPYDTYDRIMDLAENSDSKATFFFIAEGSPELDTRQLLHEPYVKRIFNRIIARGHQTGIHFSYETMHDGDHMQSEVARFFALTGRRPELSRQHYLRCDVPGTWRQWEKAGIASDYTLGYPEQPGFRCGACYPFPLFDIERQRMLHVYTFPLILMDVSFKYYADTDPASAIAIGRQLHETVRKHAGVFVMLWHNSSFAGEWKGWEHVPAQTLRK